MTITVREKTKQETLLENKLKKLEWNIEVFKGKCLHIILDVLSSKLSKEEGYDKLKQLIMELD